MPENILALGLFFSIIVTLGLCPATSGSIRSRVVWLILSAVLFAIAVKLSVPAFKGVGHPDNWPALLY